MIERVTAESIAQAAAIYSESWKESHKEICSPEFLALQTLELQKDYLEQEMADGAQIYMLTVGKPVGIVSVKDSLIANLYVLPDKQRKGYGTRLLMFAVGCCKETPTLWVLNTNCGARRLYERVGFRPTGKHVDHSDTLHESELCLSTVANVNRE